jgi:hypothetical protein
MIEWAEMVDSTLGSSQPIVTRVQNLMSAYANMAHSREPTKPQPNPGRTQHSAIVAEDLATPEDEMAMKT